LLLILIFNHLYFNNLSYIYNFILNLIFNSTITVSVGLGVSVTVTVRLKS